MPVTLRDFLYLDERLTDKFLSDLEGGHYAEEEQSRVEGENRGGEAGGGIGGFNAKGNRGRSSEDTTRRIVRQTPEGNYRRLEKLLDDEGGPQWLDALDEEIWDQLGRGEVVQVESKIKVPMLFSATDMAASIQPMFGLMEMLGEEVDAETQQQVGLLTQVGEALDKIVVVAHAAGTPKYRFICQLDREALREEVNALSGEARVVGTIQRKLAGSDTFNLLDGFGIGALPRAERRKIERDLKKDMADAVIRAPAAVLTPVAIYR